MGITFVRGTIANPADRSRVESIEFLVDTGAAYSVVPGRILRKLGIAPERVEEFTLADGSHARRRIGSAIFDFHGKRGAAPVIFGEKDDATLLGTVTLEALGIMIDPFKREIRPLPLLLA